MRQDIKINDAKEKLCPFVRNDGKHIACVGDKCMSWEFTSAPTSVPDGNGGQTMVYKANASGICKLLSH